MQACQVSHSQTLSRILMSLTTDSDSDPNPGPFAWVPLQACLEAFSNLQDLFESLFWIPFLLLITMSEDCLNVCICVPYIQKCVWHCLEVQVGIYIWSDCEQEMVPHNVLLWDSSLNIPYCTQHTLQAARHWERVGKGSESFLTRLINTKTSRNINYIFRTGQNSIKPMLMFS